MATVRIEIPIEAKDQTASGVGSVQRRLTSLDKSLEKTLKQLEKLTGTKHKVDIDADENATPKISSVEDALSAVGKSAATVEIGAHDAASEVISDVEGDAATLDGEEAVVDLSANNTATEDISSVSGDLGTLDGDEAVVNLSASDTATEEISSVSGDLSTLDGDEAVVNLSASDTATEDISSVSGDLGTLDGSAATVDISANDTASEIISDVESALSSLDGQNATVHINAADSTGFSSGGGGDAAGRFDVGDAAGIANAGAGLVKGGLGPVAGMLGLGMGASDVVNTFASFEKGMSEVGAISGATGEELDELTEKAKYMGATTKFTASEAADAFKYMAMAGWKPSQMMAGIAGIMDVAAAGGTELGATSDIVTDAMTALGIPVEGFTENGIPNVTHFADVMAKTASSANTDIMKMGETFNYVNASAGALGFSLEDVSLAAALMASAGVKSSVAGTALRRTMQSLANPTDKQLEAMQAYGITLDDGTGNARAFVDVMSDLRTNLRGLGNIRQAEAIGDMFGAQASNGIAAVVNASEEDWERLKTALYDDADGTAAQMSSEMLDNLAGSITLLSSAFDGLKIALGEGFSDELRGLIDGLTEKLPALTEAVTGAFDDIDQAFEDEGASGGVKKIAEVMTDALTTALSDVGTWFSENGGDFGEVAGQLISQLATGISSNSGELMSAGIHIVSGLAQGIVRGAGVLIGQAPTIIADLIGGILEAIPAFFQAGVELLGALKDGLISAGQGIGDFLTDIFIADPVEIIAGVDYDTPGLEVMGAAQSAMSDYESTFGQMYAGMSLDAQTFFNELAYGTRTVSELEGAMSGMDGIELAGAEEAVNAWRGIVNSFHEADAAATDTAGATEEMGDAASSSADMVQDAMDRISESTGMDMGKSGIEGVVDDLNAMAEECSQAGDNLEEALDVDLADSLGGLTGDTLTELLSADDMGAKAEEINTAMQTVADGLSQTGPQMSEAIATAMTSMTESLSQGQEAFAQLQEAATQAASEIANAFSSIGLAMGEAPETGGAAAGAALPSQLEVGGHVLFNVGSAEIDSSSLSEQVEPALSDLSVSGSVDASLSVGDENSSEVYSQVSESAQGHFNSAIPAHGTVNVHLNWHIDNPTASISVGVSGSTATATIASAGMANGGFLDEASIVLAGEAGPEYIIPVGHGHQSRGMDLWMQAGHDLGVPGFADGGVVGKSGNIWSDYLGSSGAAPVTSGDGSQAGSTANVSVSMSPVIQIDGSNGNEESIVEAIRNHIREMADDIGDEIGERLAKSFENMPLAEGV